MTAYLDFLKSKIEIAKESGFDIPDSAIHPALKPHQRDGVGYLKLAEEEANMPTLFDFMGAA